MDDLLESRRVAPLSFASVFFCWAYRLRRSSALALYAPLSYSSHFFCWVCRLRRSNTLALYACTYLVLKCIAAFGSFIRI